MPKPMLTHPVSHYVSSMRVRRELIPVPELLAYRCVTTSVDGPQPGDTVVADQTAYEDVLIELNLYPKRGLTTTLFAKAWQALHMDKVGSTVRYDVPLETLIFQLDSPHRHGLPKE